MGERVTTVVVSLAEQSEPILFVVAKVEESCFARSTLSLKGKSLDGLLFGRQTGITLAESAVDDPAAPVAVK